MNSHPLTSEGGASAEQAAEPFLTPGGAPMDDDATAMQQVTAARMHLRSAIEAYERAGYGSHVTNPLRDALRFVEFSINEVTS